MTAGEYRIQGQEPQTHLHTPQHGTRRTSDPIEPVGSRDQSDTKNAQRDKVKETALAKVEVCLHAVFLFPNRVSSSTRLCHWRARCILQGKVKDGEPDAK